LPTTIFGPDDCHYRSPAAHSLEQAHLTLEGQTSADDQIDAVYAYFSGSFGEVRFGDTYEAYAQLCYLVPSASQLFGADSPDINFSNAGIAGYAATNGTCYGLDDNSTKVVYFSPTFGGFQFVASFTPDNTEDTRNTLNGAGTRLRNDAGQNSENEPVACRNLQAYIQWHHLNCGWWQHVQLQQGDQPQRC
jgi:predicted porin